MNGRPHPLIPARPRPQRGGSAALDHGEVTGCELVMPPLLAEDDPEAVDHPGAALGWEIRRIPRAADADPEVIVRQCREMSPDACRPRLANGQDVVQGWAG